MELKQARHKMNLTQLQAANLIGISRSYYCDIEVGRKRPSPEVIERIAEVLNVSPLIFFKSSVA